MNTATAGYEALDQFGRTKHQYWRRGTLTADAVDYTYDRAGNRLSRNVRVDMINNSYVDDRDQVFAYDLLNRLKSADQKAGSTVKLKQTWGLDQLGNWSAFQQDGKNDYSSVYNNSYTDPSDLDQQRKHNSANEIAVSSGSPITVASGQSGWAIPNYDAAGNMTSMLDPTDLYNGSPTGSNYYASYDAWNRLTKINRGSQVLQINRYDGLHRRVSRESNTTGVRHFYWNEQWQCVEERTGTSTTADRQYVWHPYYIDALAISYNSSGTAHYYVQDGNFNVTAAMDSSGAVVERYSTTPYGECIVLNADFTLDSSSGGDGLSDIANEFTYTANLFSEGRRLDVETGLYQYRHRYYHAQLGRFVNRDPIGYEGSKWNLVRYVHNRPVERRDAMGTSETWDDITGVGPIDSIRARMCSNTAKEAVKGMTGSWGGEGDAVRHCTWLCCMAQSIGPGQAKTVGDNHESNSPPPKCSCPPNGFKSLDEWHNADSNMDEHNNQTGIDLGSKTPKVDCAAACKQALKDGELVVNSPGGYKGQSGCEVSYY